MKTVYYILGCTGCGKGAVGRLLAARAGGQIISIDSMKIYRRMDIGTAKPSAAARAAVPHHCIDLVEPGEGYSVAQYVAAADAAIAAIRDAAAVPLAVGGTSLYIKALSEGLFQAPQAQAGVRDELKARAAAQGLARLHKELTVIDPTAAARIHPNDERRIVRALEVHQTTGQAISDLQQQWDAGLQRHPCVFIGLRREKEDQSRRINLRVKLMVQAGLRDEVAALMKEPAGLSPQAAQAVGYAEIIRHLAGRCSFDDAVEQIKINTRQLAKKQRTWHRRFLDVRWFDLAESETAEQTVERILADVKFE